MITIANIKSELSMLPVDHPMASGRAKPVKPVVKPLDLPKYIEDQITGFLLMSHIYCLSLRRLFCYY